MVIKQEQIDYIVNNYKGQSVLSYAKSIGYNTSTVAKYLKQAGIKTTKGMNVPKKTKEKIVKEYINGLSSIKVGKKYNVHLETVLRFVKEAGHTVRSNEINSRKLQYNQDYFENIDTEDKAYWLGFIIADGCIAEKTNQACVTPMLSLNIMLSAKDKNHLEKFKKCIEYSGDVKIQTVFTQGMNRDYAIIRITNKKLCSDLAKWGVLPRKTFDCKFPYNIPNNLYKHFIRGYWDGDGYLAKTKLQIGCIGNTKFIKSIQTVCLCNVVELTKVKIGITHPTKGIATYDKGGSNQSKLLAQWLYKDANIYLDRKYKTFLNRYN